MLPAFTFWAFFFCLGGSSDLLDVCTCVDTDGYAGCAMDPRLVVILQSDCMIRGLRLTGEGYISRFKDVRRIQEDNCWSLMLQVAPRSVSPTESVTSKMWVDSMDNSDKIK